MCVDDDEHHNVHDQVLPDVQHEGGHLQGGEEENREAAQFFAANICYQKTEERFVDKMNDTLINYIIIPRTIAQTSSV